LFQIHKQHFPVSITSHTGQPVPVWQYSVGYMLGAKSISCGDWHGGQELSSTLPCLARKLMLVGVHKLGLHFTLHSPEMLTYNGMFTE